MQVEKELCRQHRKEDLSGPLHERLPFDEVFVEPPEDQGRYLGRDLADRASDEVLVPTLAHEVRGEKRGRVHQQQRNDVGMDKTTASQTDLTV